MSDPDINALRQALGAFATGVTVVTTRIGNDNPEGMTVNSFSAVSLQPPLVLWCAHRSIGPFDTFHQASHYAVHVLHAGQQPLAEHFALDTDDKFSSVPFESGIAGLPLLGDFAALFQCRVEQRLDGGDHEILLGRILRMEHRPAEPLLFHAGRFRII